MAKHNIFHKLAKNALDSPYFTGIGANLRDLDLKDQHGFWHRYYLHDPIDFYDLNSEEQALALLFLGEMYGEE